MFSYYLSLGMSYDEFWIKEPSLVKAYREAEVFRQEQFNYNAWLQGLYFHRAISASMSHLSSRKTDWISYFDYPIAMTKREKEAEKERNRQRTIRWFMSEGKDGN